MLAPEGYYVCESCGLIQDNIVCFSTENEAANRESDEITGSYIFLYDNTHYNINKNHVKRNIFITYTTKNITLLRSKDILNQVASFLNLPEKLRKNILHTLSILAEKWKNDTQSPSSLNGLIAALLYMELQRSGRYLSSRDIVTAFRKAGKRLSYSDILYGMHFLRREGLYFKINKEDEFKYIAGLLRRCGIDISYILLKKEYVEYLMEHATRIPGIRRRSIYSAIAYIVASDIKHMSYREFSRRTGIPLSTLRENTIRLRRYLKNNKLLLVRKP